MSALAERATELRLEALRREKDRREARKSLFNFSLYTDSCYQPGWHHRVLCDKLDEMIDGKIRRLMVFMPPRHGKSTIVSQKLPAYILGRDPDCNVIAASYSQDLVASMNRSVQRIIDSERYRRVFPDTQLNGKNVVTTQSWLRNSEEFEIVNKRGYYKCAGVGGGITGRGFDFGIIDDPIKGAEDASSPTMREKVWEWYTSVFLTRQQRDARILLTLTRWHEDDLAGRILANDPDGWHIIRFPAIREDDDNPEDPREIGEALWPEWYPVATLDKLRLDAGSRVWSSLYQQRPAPDDGGEFKREWFRYATTDERGRIVFPDGEKWRIDEMLWHFGTLDVAGTEKTTSDFTAYGFWMLTPSKRLVLLDRVKARLETPKLLPLIDASTKRFWLGTTHVETNGMGLPIFQSAQAAKLRVTELKQHKDKLARARFAQPWFERGDVFFMQGAEYLSDLEHELLTFPNATHDDQVDMVTMGVQVADGFVYGGVGGLLTGQVSGERRPANRLLEPQKRNGLKSERHTEMAKPWRQL